ncbi:MAG: diguanylate cyclase [Oscillospiraceae bacterium]|nr:diguanylate cyclase [Oscillospiraceae bacterium]
MEAKQLKILIVDDDRLNLEVLIKILKPGEPDSIHQNYSLSVAKTGEAALDKIKANKPDLILLDVIMPGMSGFDLLAILKKNDETRSIPVIIITGLSSVHEETKGFALGAVDYITKPFDGAVVRARVKTHLRIVEQMLTIERLGLIDSLTGITNRRGFENQIFMEWGRAIREQNNISLLLMDIDKFKTYNDTYGHQFGDTVLMNFADVLTSSINRSTDLAARWGGDEFAVLLPGTDLRGAAMVAESIRKNFESIMIHNTDGYEENPSEIKITASIGVSSEAPGINSDTSGFIKRADRNLYTAKATGRNKVCYDDKESG